SMLAVIERSTGVKLERERLHGFTDGRSDEQIRLASEIAKLRSYSRRSFRSGRAARRSGRFKVLSESRHSDSLTPCWFEAV
ncbi:MAG: hypothetical protein V7641_405, partial [Blastocatellia bacterium]